MGLPYASDSDIDRGVLDMVGPKMVYSRAAVAHMGGQCGKPEVSSSYGLKGLTLTL